MNKKTAIILGATGLTGGILLKEMIADNIYDTIKLFSRRPNDTKSSKIIEYIVDLHKLDEYEYHFKGDEVFCCIGTTASKTKDV